MRGVRWKGFRLGNVAMKDPLYGLGYRYFNPVSVDTDNVATEYGVSRKEQDAWALRSRQNYGRAWREGKFRDEIMALEIPQKKGESQLLNIDEQYRPDSSLEKLAALSGIYGCKGVTAGNAPGLNDGSAAILFMTRTEPLAEIAAMSAIAQPSKVVSVQRPADLIFRFRLRVPRPNEAWQNISPQRMN